MIYSVIFSSRSKGQPIILRRMRLLQALGFVVAICEYDDNKSNDFLAAFVKKTKSRYLPQSLLHGGSFSLFLISGGAARCIYFSLVAFTITYLSFSLSRRAFPTIEIQILDDIAQRFSAPFFLIFRHIARRLRDIPSSFKIE